MSDVFDFKLPSETIPTSTDNFGQSRYNNVNSCFLSYCYYFMVNKDSHKLWQANIVELLSVKVKIKSTSL